jgi:D-amino-acid dehydrogenase
MKIVVIGAGVIGVTSAWYLARDGHQVTVLERRNGPGLETSFANGGQISTSHAMPWSSPAVPGQLLRWLGRPRAPLKMRLRGDREQFAWCLRFLRECLPARHLRNATHSLRLTLFSRAELDQLRQETAIRNDHAECGILSVFTSERDFDRGRDTANFLADHGVSQEILLGEEVLRVEPALGGAENVVGGVYSADDQVGDAYLFTAALAAAAQRRGVRFYHRVRVTGLQRTDGRISAVVTTKGLLKTEAVVLCAGSYSAALLRPLELELPVYPVKGYSVTLPISSPAAAPRVSLTDEAHKLVISRLGNRLRAAGTAEIAGYDTTLNRRRAETVLDALLALLPKAGDPARAEFWTGLRPMTPDGPPVIGPTPIANLFLNTGHGTLGWTMAAGSARLLADVVAGRPPALSLEGLTFDRY